MSSVRTYVHYGNKTFSDDKWNHIQNRLGNKPFGGLWASPDDAEFGWKDWNVDQNYTECNEADCFRFALREGARVYMIDSIEALRLLPTNIDKEILITFKGETVAYKPEKFYPDFEKITEQYDVIEFMFSNDWRLYDALYGWDCDCVLVLNKSVIKTTEATDE